MKTPTLDSVLDEYLVTASRSGDPKAMHLLVKRWNPRLARFAGRFVGDPDQVRDVVQEAWIGIMRGLPRLEDPGRFRAWSYRIVANKATDLARRQQSRRRALDSLAAEATGQEGGEGGLSASVRRALDEVSDEQRTLLALFYVDGFSVKEIGEVLGVPEGTVKSRLYHARRAVKVRLEEGSR